MLCRVSSERWREKERNKQNYKPWWKKLEEKRPGKKYKTLDKKDKKKNETKKHT